ncbi:calcium/sodium antiporter [Patescibacteria group bacterium]|nr:calcium/sodium antiporter [Patescibacteria group bacterium]
MLFLLFGIIFAVVCGVFFLYKGADLLVERSSVLAAKLGVSTFVIGLSVITLGSIAPELSVGISSSLSGANDLILGNALGASIFKLAFVFGLAALISPMSVEESVLKREFVWLIAASVLFFLLSLDRVISRGDAILLILLSLVFQACSVFISKKTVLDEIGKTKVRKHGKNILKTSRSWAMIILGIVLIIAGAKILVHASLYLAEILSIPQILIGIIIIAFGTSIPELVVTVMSSARHQPSLGIGNIIGTNVMHIFLVVGIAALIQPLVIGAQLLSFDFPVLIFMTLLVAVFFKSSHRLSRFEGGLLVAGYIWYLVYSIKVWA